MTETKIKALKQLLANRKYINFFMAIQSYFVFINVWAAAKELAPKFEKKSVALTCVYAVELLKKGLSIVVSVPKMLLKNTNKLVT